MKKIFIYILVVLPMLIFGQTPTENYVMSTTYKVPTSTSIVAPTAAQAVQNIQYFDGLGRLKQQIAGKQSGTGKDIVTHTEYDNLGRQVKEYLPYVKWYGTSNLDYMPSALAETGAYYNNYDPSVSGNVHFEQTLFPFSEKEFEKSPMNNLLKQSAPGQAWAMGSGKEIKMEYQTNTASEVRYFKATAVPDAQYGVYNYSLTSNGTNYYEVNQLYKTIVKNENWISGKNNTTEEFKDKEGHIVLKRTYSDYTSLDGNLISSEVPHDTYYVYDQYGNLTYVIPPIVNIAAGINKFILSGYCYQYRYDFRNRLVEKRLPGKQSENMVYDKLNRVIATGPAFDPFGSGQTGWLITKYDGLNRVVYTGWNAGQEVRNELQSIQDNSVNIINEEKTSPITIDGVLVAYTNNIQTYINGVFKLLTVNYYDDYTFPDAPSAIPSSVMSDSSQNVYYNNTIKPKGLPTGSWVRVLDDASLNTYEKSFILYDDKAQPIRTYKSNYVGGFTQADSKIDFSGKVLVTETTHKRLLSDTATTVTDVFNYTAQDRLLSNTNQVNGGAVQLISKNTYDELGQLISKNVGGTDVSGAVGIQKIDYRYNVRGWLTDINDVNDMDYNMYLFDLFSLKINYNTTQGGVSGISPLYNGNISEIYWRSAYDMTLRKYGYRYDNLNRLTNAVYQKPEDATPVPHFYDENVTYDKNGNILRLTRNGNEDYTLPAIGIDDLTYAYDYNHLLRVTDNPSGNTSGFKDDTLGNGTSGANDYDYDANGNMVRDDNKNISLVTYNHLNLPVVINFIDTNNRITYLYNALGEKVAKKVKYLKEYFPPWYPGPGDSKSSPIYVDHTDATEYLAGGFQYVNAVLQFFPHAEGYVRADDLVYVFNYKDHLGNIRFSYVGDVDTGYLDIIDEAEYYPFGLKHENYAYSADVNSMTYKYKYNGKEYQNDLGINLYYYGYRNYDPAIARWTTMDPLLNDLDFTFNPNDVDEDDAAQVEISYLTTLGNGGGIYNRDNLNSYAYGYNNPVRFDDPDGRCPNCFTALAGALIGGGIELGGQLLSGKSLNEVDWVDVGVEFVKGGSIGSGVGAFAAAGIEAGSVVTKAAFDYSGKEGAKNVVNGKKSVKEAAFDGAADVVAGKVGGAVGKKLGNITEGNVKAATKAEAKATKEISKATNKFNKATDGGKNMIGSKSMLAKNTLEKAKGGAQVARGNTVRSQMVNSATKGPAGQTVNNGVQNSITDKVKSFFGF